MRTCSRRSPLATWALSICLSLTFWASCKPRIQQIPVPIGEARIVGRVVAGAVVWEPNEDQARDYLVVTKAYPVELFRVAHRIRELELEIERLKAEGKK